MDEVEIINHVVESNFLKLIKQCYSLKEQNSVKSAKRTYERCFSDRGHQLSNGTFGIKALESSFVTARQIEAARISATRYMKREGSLWIKIFPDKPITKKPLEVRMGKGKGAVEYWAAVVKPGRILFEISGVPLRRSKRSTYV